MAVPGNILVIRGGAIGDFILTLPVLAALREQFPDCRLEVLGYPHIAELARAAGLADEVSSLESRAMAEFFAVRGQLNEDLCSYFEKFHLIISFLFDPVGVFEANIGRCSKAQFLSGPHRPDDNGDAHATQCLLEPLQRLAIFDAPDVPRLILPASPPTSPTGQRKRLAVHPGSGSEKKNWPERHWEKFLKGLLEKHPSLDVLMVGGEAETGRLECLARQLPSDRITLAQQRPLPELGGLLQSADAFLGHDSGISHLAAALGLPAVILWGPTRERVWRPKGDSITILRHDSGLSDLPVAIVHQAIDQIIS